MADLNMDYFNSFDDFNPFDKEEGVEDIEKNEEQIVSNLTGKDIKVDEEQLDKEKLIDGDEIFSSQEGVDEESNQDDESVITNSNDNSPDFYTSIANTLLEDGILTLDESKVKEAKTAEDLANLMKEQLYTMLDEKQQRYNKALDNNVELDDIKKFEGALNYLDSISEDILRQESEDAENLRKNLIYQDLLNRGFKPERAKHEVEKSLTAGTDIEDAILSLESNKEFFNQEYDKLIQESEKEILAKEKKEKDNAKLFEKKILETEEPIKGLKLNKKIREDIYKTATKFVDKDDKNIPLNSIQKYAKENPIDYQYKLSLLFYLTDGFNDLNKLIGKEVKEQTKSSFRNLEKILKNPPVYMSNDDDYSTNSKDKNTYSGIRYAYEKSAD